MIKKVVTLTLLAVLAGCAGTAQKQDKEPETKKAKNIILLIGDGMGLTQVSSSFYFQEDSTNFWRFPVTGLSQTSSTSRITDSAAGATAFSSGIITYNGAVGVDTDSVAVDNIVELLSPKGWKSGVISTSSIQHATPASFYAHVKSRSMYEEISEHLVDSDIDFFAGGGHYFFTTRKDSINYLTELGLAEFEWDTTALHTNFDHRRKYGFLLAPNAMPQANQDRGDFLLDATDAGIQYFTASEDPFFLMVEGSQIDWGGHANDAEYLIAEQLDFDKVIGHVLDFAEKDGNTLVIVTADHETGGYALSSTPTEGGGSDYDQVTPTFSTGGHTTTLVPVFAYGPGAENFTGVYKNSAIYNKMLKSIKMEE